MKISLFYLLLGCYPSFPFDEANKFPDNPSHDYDKDNLTEEQGDCNDLDINIMNGSMVF
jgi:hypothetical protein